MSLEKINRTSHFFGPKNGTESAETVVVVISNEVIL